MLDEKNCVLKRNIDELEIRFGREIMDLTIDKRLFYI